MNILDITKIVDRGVSVTVTENPKFPSSKDVYEVVVTATYNGKSISQELRIKKPCFLMFDRNGLMFYTVPAPALERSEANFVDYIE
jgi:hypothetical protein